MRLLIVAAVLAFSVQTAVAAEKWATAYAQGTIEASIDNAAGASMNIYCPSGQNDTTPGMLLQSKKVQPRAGERVAVAFVVDGKIYLFDFDEIEFKASGPQVKELSVLIDAIAKSKAPAFKVDFPKLGKSEQFSLAGAKAAFKSAKEFLDGCM